MATYVLDNNPDDYNLYKIFYSNFIVKKISYFDSSIHFSNDILAKYETAIFENYIDGTVLTFDEKIRLQLENKSRELRHFSANLLWLYNFFLSSIVYGSYKVDKAVKTKRQEVQNVLNETVSIDLFPSIGYANAGQAYKTKKYEELAYFYIFVKKVYSQPELLEVKNLDALLSFVENMNLATDLPQKIFRTLNKTGAKNILLFLLAPEKYEPIISYTDKIKIVKAYYPDGINDINKALLYIRYKYNITDSFYSSKNIKVWNGQDSLPKAIIIQKNNTNLKNTFRKTKIEDKDDLQESYFCNIDTGLEGENIVAEMLYKKYLDKLNASQKSQSVMLIQKSLLTIGYKLDDISANVLNKNLQEISHFSKNIHTKAPFDIIYTQNAEVFFVEVKSTSNNNQSFKIYFSLNELDFAIKNAQNYELYVVKNNSIFEVDTNDLLSIFDDILTYNIENSEAQIEQISLFISILE